MTMPRGSGQGTGPRNPISPKPFGVPQVWWEWWASIWDTDEFTLEPQGYGATIVAGTIAGNTNTIQVPEPYFCFGTFSRAFITATGLVWTTPYRIGFKVANGNDWYNGNWLAPIVTGDVGGVVLVPNGNWTWPKTLTTNEIVTVTVDNNLAAAAGLTVDVLLQGFVVRRLRERIERDKAA